MGCVWRATLEVRSAACKGSTTTWDFCCVEVTGKRDKKSQFFRAAGMKEANKPPKGEPATMARETQHRKEKGVPKGECWERKDDLLMQI